MKTILIAEDNDSNFILMNYILKRSYRILRAHDGKEAVETVEKGGVDLILMDLKMPVLDGLEATRIIKENFPALPVIMLTANAFESDRQAAFSVGCDDFLSKPVYSAVCLETIAKYI